MNDIEKCARELLAAEYSKVGLTLTSALVSCGRSEGFAVRAIIAALSAAPKEEHSGGIDNSKSLCKCDCGCGRDCCANCGADLGFLPRAVTHWMPLPPLPIAFFDEFGRGADDRVQDYARAALAARQPVGVEPVVEIGECAEVVWLQGGPCKLPPGAKLYTAPPAPAAVPVDGDKPHLLTGQLRSHLQHLVRAGRYLEDRVVETLGAKCMDDFDYELNQVEKLIATHPQPAAAKEQDDA